MKSLQKHNSGWLWPLIGIFVVVLIIWWVSGNQSAGPMPESATTTQQQQQPAAPRKSVTTKAPAQVATDVASVAEGVANGTIFSSWLRSTGVASQLQGAGPYTLFLPTDAAIAQLPTGTFKNLSSAEQRRFVQNHVISGKVINAEAQVSGTIWTLSGDPLNFTRNAGQSALVGSSVIVAQYRASNGVVYVINGVLIPPHRPLP